MSGITPGVAAALIVLAVAVLQAVLRNALTLILTDRLQETHTAVEWSIISRFFLNSDWPILLRSESVSSRSASRNIAIITWAKPFGLLLLAVAAVVTPLGIHEGISLSSSSTNVEFVYVADQSVFGSGTPPRNTKVGFSRTCTNRRCPGEPDMGNVTTVTTLSNDTNVSSTYYTRAP